MTTKKDTFLELLENVDETLLAEAGEAREAGKQQKYYAKYAWRRGICVAAASILLVVMLIANPQTRAAMHETISRFAGFWETNTDLTPYAEVIDTSQTKSGVTLTLKEVMQADNKLYVCFALDAKEEVSLDQVVTFTVDGGKSSNVFSIGAEERKIESSERLYMVTYTLKDGMIKEEMANYKIQVYVKKQGKSIPYTFAFRATGEEIAAETIQKNLDQTIDFGSGYQMKLTEIQFNTVNSRIKMEAVNIPKETKAYYLEGEDSLGNSVMYSLYFENAEDMPDYPYFESDMVTGLPDLSAEWVDLQLRDTRFNAETGYYEEFEDLGDSVRIYLH